MGSGSLRGQAENLYCLATRGILGNSTNYVAKQGHWKCNYFNMLAAEPCVFVMHGRHSNHQRTRLNNPTS
jgi:hypothetical protein